MFALISLGQFIVSLVIPEPAHHILLFLFCLTRKVALRKGNTCRGQRADLPEQAASDEEVGELCERAATQELRDSHKDFKTVVFGHEEDDELGNGVGGVPADYYLECGQ